MSDPPKPSGAWLPVLHAHMPYVISRGRSPHGSQWFWEAAAHCDLPLLAVLRQLIDERIDPRLTIDQSPALCRQLARRPSHPFHPCHIDGRHSPVYKVVGCAG